MLAIIGGSGLTQLANLSITRREVIRTPYGEPSGALLFGELTCKEIVFLARHGYGHTVPPHKVNYRANMWALKQVGVTQVISVASVGGIRGDLGPGALVIPHQIIDYTYGRNHTYFDGDDGQVVHVDFTEPYTESLRQSLLAAAKAAGEEVADGAVYACTQGPRLESAAEITRLERDGADVVGMTAMPEAVLARELGLEYAAINVVANWAAGRADSKHSIQFSSLEGQLQRSLGRVRDILEFSCAVERRSGQ